MRPLLPADIPALTGVLTRAYVSQQNFALRLTSYLSMRAVATFVADIDGMLVGMVVGNDYGSTAYVSQMAVEPSRQRQGIGTALMDELVDWGDAREFAAIELDATPSGAPLYAKYGFRNSGETGVYRAHESGGRWSGVRPFAEADRSSLLAADVAAFGSDRSDVLNLLLLAAETTVVVAHAGEALGGYAVAQPVVERLGPVIAQDSVIAGRLIDAARTQLDVGHLVSVPSEHLAARATLGARGYKLTRTLAHMIRGSRPMPQQPALFARINLGQG